MVQFGKMFSENQKATRSGLQLLGRTCSFLRCSQLGPEPREKLSWDILGQREEREGLADGIPGLEQDLGVRSLVLVPPSEVQEQIFCWVFVLSFLQLHKGFGLIFANIFQASSERCVPLLPSATARGGSSFPKLPSGYGSEGTVGCESTWDLFQLQRNCRVIRRGLVKS